MNNDLISRKALIEAVEDMYEYAELGEVLDVIKTAPTVEPENERALDLIDSLKDRNAINNRERGILRRAILLNENTRPHGKWEEDWQEDLDFMSRKGWKCPFCKWRTTYGTPNFCMNCGADMREDSDK